MASQTPPLLDFQVPVVKCELCQENNAEYFCQDCQEYMCGHCKTAHLRSKVSRHHNVVVSVLGRTEESRIKKSVKCSKHSTEHIQMYCINCELPVCHTCIADVHHKNHSFDKLETALERYKREITGIISETKQYISELEESLRTIDIKANDYITASDQTVSRINKKRKVIKSQADKVADSLIDQVEKRKTRDLQLLEKDKDSRQKLIFDQKEYLQTCEDTTKSFHDYSSLQRQIKKSTKPNPRPITSINPLAFVSDDTRDVQDMFGTLVYSLEPTKTKRIPAEKKVQKEEDRIDRNPVTTVSTEIVTKINPGIYCECVTVFNEKEAWCIGGGLVYCDTILLVDIHGHIKRKMKVDYHVFDTQVTPTGDLLVTQYNGTIIKKYLQDGTCTKIADTKPYKTRGLNVTSQGDVLVCLYRYSDDNKVVRMTAAGQIKQTIQKDKRHQSLFTKPRYVVENINGDIVVVDGNNPATIVVVNKEGELRYKYPDVRQVSHTIGGCGGIARDNIGCILVSDRFNNRVHQIDRDGRFLQFILSKHHGIQSPLGLCIDTKNQLWICNKEGYEIIVFKYRWMLFSIKNANPQWRYMYSS